LLPFLQYYCHFKEIAANFNRLLPIFTLSCQFFDPIDLNSLTVALGKAIVYKSLPPEAGRDVFATDDSQTPDQLYAH
jgi:hypothetical protein